MLPVRRNGRASSVRVLFCENKMSNPVPRKQTRGQIGSHCWLSSELSSQGNS